MSTQLLQEIIDAFIIEGNELGYKFFIKDKSLIVDSIDTKYTEAIANGFSGFRQKEVVENIIHQLYYTKLKDPTYQNKDLYSISLTKLSMNFYEATFLSLSASAKEIFIEMSPLMFGANKIHAYLETFKNSYFANEVLKKSLEDSNLSYIDILESCLNQHNKKETFELEDKTLLVLCKTSQYELKDIKLQYLLKKTVEQDFTHLIEQCKKYYKKTDLSNLNKVTVQYQAFVISFDKLSLHNINSNNPEEKECLQRLKKLVTLLNKKTMQKKFKLTKVLFDGVGAKEKDYSFIFISEETQFPYKEQLKSIILEVAGNSSCLDAENIQKTINYLSLDNQLSMNKPTYKTLKI